MIIRPRHASLLKARSVQTPASGSSITSTATPLPKEPGETNCRNFQIDESLVFALVPTVA
jgi:hypothetical protein